MKGLMLAVIFIGLTGAACVALPVDKSAELPSADAGIELPMVTKSGNTDKSTELPIVNAHEHLNRDVSAEQLIELMDKAGVSRQVIMARYYFSQRDGGGASDQLALQYSKKYPGRFLPFVAGQRGDLWVLERWLSPDVVAERYLNEAEEKLKSGNFYGIGELIMRHYAYNLGMTDHKGFQQGGGEGDFPIDSPLMHRLADLAAKYDVPLLIHAEGEPQVIADMNRLLNYNPKTKIIWAHNCGRCSAETISKMLTGHPNLYCDLGGMQNAPWAGYGRYWPRWTPWMFLIEGGFGNLMPEMKELYEAFSDRFLLGTDCAHTPALRHYHKRVERFRKILSDFSPVTARRLAYENAEKLFKINNGKNSK